MGDNQVAKSLSSQFFITAVLLALFGLAENAPSSGLSSSSQSSLGMIQLVLAAAMAGAGVFLRGGTPAARALGLCVAGATSLVGAYALLSGMGYVPGTIVAIYGLFHLLNAEAAFTGLPQPGGECDPLPYSPGTPPTATAGFAPAPYGQSSPPAQPPTTDDRFGYFGARPTPAPTPFDPAPPPQAPPTAPSDPRFGA